MKSHFSNSLAISVGKSEKNIFSHYIVEIKEDTTNDDDEKSLEKNVSNSRQLKIYVTTR
jgi:hypothetical protein